MGESTAFMRCQANSAAAMDCLGAVWTSLLQRSLSITLGSWSDSASWAWISGHRPHC